MRTYKLLSDGRRQISAFHLPGDIFGLVNSGEHRFTAEAIVNTTVRLIKRHSLDAFAVSDPVVAASLLTMTTSNLQHAENHILLLGRKNSMERVAAFLVEMDKRMALTTVLSLCHVGISRTTLASPLKPYRAHSPDCTEPACSISMAPIDARSRF